ncbi:MAG: hypothetical protein ACKN87_24610, partial [Microcystis aeruginosa]
YGDWYLVGVLMQEALLLAVLGYWGVGVLGCWVLGFWGVGVLVKIPHFPTSPKTYSLIVTVTWELVKPATF